MSSWEELAAKHKFRTEDEAPAAASAPAPDQMDVWRTLAATHKMPNPAVTSQQPDNSELGQIQQRMVADMPVGQRMGAQIGSGMTDVSMGLKQIFGQATPAEMDEKRQLDKALVDAPGGGLLSFSGQTAPTLVLPFGAVSKGLGKVLPKVGPKTQAVVEGAVQGGVSSGVQGVGTGDSRLFNTLAGSTLGTVIPAVGAAYRGAAGSTSAESAALAKKAIDQYKIPLTASDITDSNFLKSLNSLSRDLPVVGGRVAARNDAKQRAFNKATGETFGAEGERLTTDVVSKAHGNITKTFDDIYARNPANVFDVNAEIQPVMARLAKEGTDQQKKIVQSRIDELYSRIDPQTGTIDGQFFNRWQSSLRKAAGNDDLLNELRSATLRAYNNGISGTDAELLKLNRTRYRNFKTVEPLLDKAATGDISPGLLQGRVAAQTSNYAMGGGGELGDLARIGSRFMVDRTPQTGGSARGLLQNSIVANGVALPLAAPVQGLLNTDVVRNSIISRALQQQQVARGLLDSPSAPLMIREIVKRGAIQGTPAAGMGLLGFNAS